MLNTGSLRPKAFISTRLTMPIFGLPSRIHDTVNRMPGITSGISAIAKNSDLNGVLVRSLSQARLVPSRKAKVAVPKANCSELPNRRGVSLLV